MTLVEAGLCLETVQGKIPKGAQMSSERVRADHRLALPSSQSSTHRERYVILSILLMLLFSGCFVSCFAVDKIGDALASSGSTSASDDDLQLVGEALPFGLKLM